MEFKSSPGNTVGVEWELQLLDPVSLDLVDGIVPLMEFFPDTTFVKPEYIQSCVELTSCVADNSEQAVDHLAGSFRQLLQRCAELEMGLCGAGTHPFCRRLALITPLPRYQRIEKSTGYLGHTQITFSTHVHVGMDSGDEAMRAMSFLIPAMPVFIALSANSPFWRGHETGHAAYRQRILAAAPSYGLPTRFENWRTYDKFLDAASRSGMIRTFKDIHWDIRPHPDFGTLEVRAMDAASDLQTLRGLVAFARSLTRLFANASAGEVSRVLPLNLPRWAENQNRYHAGLLGLDARYIIDDTGRHRPLRDIASELIEICEPTAADIHESTGLRITRGLLTGVAACQRQVRAYRQNNSARSVVKLLQDELVEGI